MKTKLWIILFLMVPATASAESDYDRFMKALDRNKHDNVEKQPTNSTIDPKTIEIMLRAAEAQTSQPAPEPVSTARQEQQRQHTRTAPPYATHTKDNRRPVYSAEYMANRTPEIGIATPSMNAAIRRDPAMIENNYLDETVSYKNSREEKRALRSIMRDGNARLESVSGNKNGSGYFKVRRYK